MPNRRVVLFAIRWVFSVLSLQRVSYHWENEPLIRTSVACSIMPSHHVHPLLLRLNFKASSSSLSSTGVGVLDFLVAAALAPALVLLAAVPLP